MFCCFVRKQLWYKLKIHRLKTKDIKIEYVLCCKDSQFMMLQIVKICNVVKQCLGLVKTSNQK